MTVVVQINGKLRAKLEVSADDLENETKIMEMVFQDKKIQKSLLEIKNKYGKNSILKAMDYEEGATQKDRNEQIGGHKA